ncbi:MAG: DJ-1/PfpI family protein [Bacteroidales bacterium]|nr:DJ-1/PfpI family protein [Bacteroidales bacterium]
MGKSYIILAAGFEEVEALAPVDILRRGGVEVETVSITSDRMVVGAHGVGIQADLTWDQADIAAADWIILPGGIPGAPNLAGFAPLCEALKIQHLNGKGIAAICASPAVVLNPLGILEGVTATCYPGCEKGTTGTDWHTNERVIAHPGLITANGPSSAFPFALAILEAIAGKAVAEQVAAGTLYI